MAHDRFIGEPLLRPIPNRYAVCSLTCELMDKSVERAAIMVIALRHLAHAHHWAHRATVGGVTWSQCHEHFCEMAHKAIEGKLTLGNRTASGAIVAVVPAKEGK